jgi:hypothetical protein
MASAFDYRFVVEESPFWVGGAKFINIIFYLVTIKYKLVIKKLETVNVKCLKMLKKS